MDAGVLALSPSKGGFGTYRVQACHRSALVSSSRSVTAHVQDNSAGCMGRGSVTAIVGYALSSPRR